MVILVIVLFIVIANLQTWAQENTQTIQKELPAVKTDQPPTIDGILNDACWQDAPQATGFTDERTEKPAKNQSVGRVVYTDTAIYVGLHLYDDMPDKIVARQTKDQTRIRGEDWVSFSLDPFHTHQFSDRNFFIVNPLGTKFAHLATGRAEKTEWIGLWKTAAQIVEDGWIVEMEIPWQMLDYPDTTQPVRMGINIDRLQQRTGERSWWCNLGVQEFRENDGHWIDVLPPSRKRELKFLPYLIGGTSEMETNEREYTARAGADIRYEVTPQLRIIGTVNPDFENIEQAVEGIDFSYGERYVPDRRPFFSEGGNVYRLGRLFHSRRITDMDSGLKLFGKIGKNTSVGTLGTYHRNNQNVIFQASQSPTATSNISAAFLSHHHRDTEMNNVVGLAQYFKNVLYSRIMTRINLSEKKQPLLANYCQFLLAGFQNFTQTYFADRSDTYSHDQLNRLLSHERIPARKLWESVKNDIAFNTDGYLLFDDTVLPKPYAKSIESVRRQWSGSEKRVIQGIGIVTCVYVNPKTHAYWIIDYRIYDHDRDGKTKLQHLLDMLKNAYFVKRLKFRTVLVDSWYASMRVLKAIEALSKIYYAPLKRNRLVSISVASEYQRVEALTWTDIEAAEGKVVHINKFPKGHEVKLFRLVSGSGRTEYIATNDLSQSDTKATKQECRLRWKIEQFHRELKQTTGIGKCQSRKHRGQRNHIACCFWVWVSLTRAARATGQTIYQLKESLFDDYIRREIQKPSIIVNIA